VPEKPNREAVERFAFLCGEIADRIREQQAGWRATTPMLGDIDELLRELTACSNTIGLPHPPIREDISKEGTKWSAQIELFYPGESQTRRMGTLWNGDTSVDEWVPSNLPHWRGEAIICLERWQRHVKSPLFCQKGLPPSEANVKKLFPAGIPSDPDIIDLAVRIQANSGSGKSMRQTAREYTGETMQHQPRADSLLARIRMMRNRGKLNL